MITLENGTLAIEPGLEAVPLPQIDRAAYIDLRFKNLGHLAAAKEASAEDSRSNIAMRYDWQADAHRCGAVLNYGLVAGGELAGEIGADLIMPDKPAVHYWLGQDYTGQGIATKGVKALVGKLFVARGARQVNFLIRPENTASQAVARRVGAYITGNSGTYDWWAIRRRQWQRGIQ